MAFSDVDYEDDDTEDDRLGKTEPLSASKTHWGEDSNELLMYFRSKKKTARDVSLYERSEQIKRATRSNYWISWRAANRNCGNVWWKRKTFCGYMNWCQRCWMSGKIGSSGGDTAYTILSLQRSGK